MTDLSGDGGVIKRVTKKGTGLEYPIAGRKVSLHYVGKLADSGVVFDTSRSMGISTPMTFMLGTSAVIKGFDIAVLSMTTGEHATFTLRSDYAYAKKGSPAQGDFPAIPPNADLVFELELLGAPKESAAEKREQDAKIRLELLKEERAKRVQDKLDKESEDKAAALKEEEEKAKAKADAGFMGAKKGKGKKGKPAKAAASGELDRIAVKKMKPKDLKKELKSRGLSAQGTKKDLIARLTEAVEA